MYTVLKRWKKQNEALVTVIVAYAYSEIKQCCASTYNETQNGSLNKLWFIWLLQSEVTDSDVVFAMVGAVFFLLNPNKQTKS